MTKKLFSVCCFLAVIFPQMAFAHAFGQQYTLPVPLWLYIYAGGATVFISFLLIGLFIKKSEKGLSYKRIDLSKNKFWSFFGTNTWKIFWKIISLALFIFTIVAGFIGTNEPTNNFNMSFFWIIFLLGCTYTTFLCEDIWSTLNPLKIVVEIFEKVTAKEVNGFFRYPEKLAYWPAFLLYFSLLWFELIAGPTPFSLSAFVSIYSFLTFTAVILFGKKNWFQFGEFFSVFFGLISKISWFERIDSKLFFRAPFLPLIKEKLENLSLLLFILLILSSTAFDGFRETGTYFSCYLQSLYPLQSWLQINSSILESLLLFLSPFLFFTVYWLFIFLMKIFTRSTLSTKKLALRFGYTLIPIAFVYHLAHYYTLFIVQGQDIIRLLSDPFGRDWNLFGTATFKPNIALLGAKFIWHSQVALIVFGHMVAVYLAHILAIHIFKSSKKSLISQIPMFFLMVLYTMMGLWILAQPLSGKSLTNEIQQEKQLPPPDNPENFFIRHPAMPTPPISPK